VDHDKVAFEVDGYDADARSGWSVLVQGTAVVEDAEADVQRLDRVARRPWVPAHEEASTWVRVRARSITGRELG
jgi:uncharacterized protein